MAISNVFRQLTKSTGTFLTFSQYAEDLTKCQNTIGTKVVPSKFVTLNIDFNGYDNSTLPALFQNNFENGCAFLKNKENWTPDISRNLFWNAMGEANFINSINYIGDINIESYNKYDGMGYNEIYCYIPNEAKPIQVSINKTDKEITGELYDKDYICGYGEEDIDIKGVNHIKLDSPITYYQDCLYPIDLSNNAVVGTTGVTGSTGVTDQKYFEFNTIVVFYDVLNENGEPEYKDIPLGIYFTGLIEDNIMTNSVKKFVSNNDIYGAGTSYGLRICSRFSTTSNSTIIKDQNGYNVETTVEPDEDYAALSRVMSQFAESQLKMDEYINSLNTGYVQTFKDHLNSFTSSKTNVPYILDVNGIPYWFVNGKNTGQPATNTKGLIGATGPAGIQGVTGPVGSSLTILDVYNDLNDFEQEVGSSGQPGDAYIVEENLYIWSSQKAGWINTGNIVGEQGPQGEAGLQGVTGPAGKDGQDGKQGETGPKGEAGLQGVTGPKGEKGDPGDSYEPANKSELEKIEIGWVDEVNENEQVVAAALNDLNTRLDKTESTIEENAQITSASLNDLNTKVNNIQNEYTIADENILTASQTYTDKKFESIQVVSGVTGPTGPQGVTGLQGVTGPAGKDGTGVSIKGSVSDETELPSVDNENGDSYLINGSLYVWDGSKWNNVGYIQGPTGPQGEQGAQGEQGEQGVTGPAGKDGIQGATGPKGEDGLQGVTGPVGKDGIQGVTGPKGEDGLQGVTGPKGEDGLQGVTGPAGKDGLQGVTGTGVFSITTDQKTSLVNTINNATGVAISINDLSEFLTACVDGSGISMVDLAPAINTWASANNINGSFIVDSILFTMITGGSLTNYYDLKGTTGATGPKGEIGPTGPQGEPGYAPIGAIVMWPGVLTTDKTTWPAGWLLCNGNAYDIEGEYNNLYKIIEDTYTDRDGALDPGDNKFRVPDLTQRFPLGSNFNYTLGTIGGTTNATYNVTSNMKNAGNYSLNSTGNNYESRVVVTDTTGATPSITVTSDHLPPYLAINFIIRYK